MENTKISVIIPIYNTEKYLPTCLDSVLSQTHKNFELILIDDGSSDNSGKIADDYAKKDSRVRVIHQKNAGQSAARNYGLKLATGDFISFIDSDDEVKKTFLADLLAPFFASTPVKSVENPVENSAKNPAKSAGSSVALPVCGFHYKRLRQNTAKDVYINPLPKRRFYESKKAYLLKLLAIDGRMYSSLNKLYRADIAKTLHFEENLNFAEDTKFVLDYLKKAYVKKDTELAFVLKPLYIYNFGTETSTIKKTAVDWQNWQTSYKNLKSWLGPHPTICEFLYLHLVHLRWRVSLLRSRKRARND